MVRAWVSHGERMEERRSGGSSSGIAAVVTRAAQGTHQFGRRRRTPVFRSVITKVIRHLGGRVWSEGW